MHINIVFINMCIVMDPLLYITQVFRISQRFPNVVLPIGYYPDISLYLHYLITTLQLNST